MKKNPLVLIKWKDITSSHAGWFTDEEVSDLDAAYCYTPGWILKEDEKNYYVVSALVRHKKDWNYSFDTVIPKGVVDSITTVRKNWA